MDGVTRCMESQKCGLCGRLELPTIDTTSKRKKKCPILPADSSPLMWSQQSGSLRSWVQREKSVERMSMLGKCANPACPASFRKLGNGKLFAFESVAIASSVDWGTRNDTRSRSPVFFWLCECCSLSFTLQLDASGRLTMVRVPDGVRVTIFDGHPLDQAG